MEMAELCSIIEKKNMLICIRNVEYILELKETLKLRGNNTFPLVIP